MVRVCPICGDPIPETAHRNKKLCGKKVCLDEQQRRSGRKSYHKLLKHTKPEKRSCIACGDDISDLRGNRVVCMKPECERERKRRSGNAYFFRTLDNEEIQEKRRMSLKKYRESKRANRPRLCQICRDDISGLERGRTICEKQSCIEYRDRLRAQKGRYVAAKNVALRPIKIKRSTPVRRKPVAKPRRVIPEDDIPWTPTPSFPTGEMPRGSIVSRPADADDDPWNCLACRESENKRCRLHASMEVKERM